MHAMLLNLPAFLTALTMKCPYCVMSVSSDLLTRKTPYFIPDALANKQPRLKSRGLQSVISNAGEGLQKVPGLIKDVDKLRSCI